jgi:hypothetical protein
MESGRVRHYPFVRFRPAVGARRGRGRSAPRGRDATPAPAYPDLSSRGRGVLRAPECWCWVLAGHDQSGRGSHPHSLSGGSVVCAGALVTVVYDRISTPETYPVVITFMPRGIHVTDRPQTRSISLGMTRLSGCPSCPLPVGAAARTSSLTSKRSFFSCFFILPEHVGRAIKVT